MSRSSWRHFGAIGIVATFSVASVWIVFGWTLPDKEYISVGREEQDASRRYKYEAKPECYPSSLMRLTPEAVREAKQIECRVEASGHKREVDDLTQQTRAAEAVEKANWFADQSVSIARIQAVLSVVALVATAWAAWAASVAARAAEDAVEQTRRSTTAAINSAAAAAEANGIATRGLILDNRAWLLHERLFFLESPIGGGHLDLHVVFQNSGRTPALNVDTQVVVEFAWTEDQTITFRPVPSTGVAGDVVGPNHSFSGAVQTIPPADVAELVANRVFLVAYSHAEYRDIFEDTPARVSKATHRADFSDFARSGDPRHIGFYPHGPQNTVT